MMRGMEPVLAKALELLAGRDHFAAELEEKLRRRGFSREEIAVAVQRCRELGFLDEARLARRFVEVQAGRKGWGPRRIEAELARRGVPREVAAAAVREAERHAARALAVALERAERRAPGGWWRLPAARARMVTSLLRRGFDPEEARRAVEELAARRERGADAQHDQLGDP